MPIPTPKKEEEKSDFMSRCMSFLYDKKEFKDSDQRSAVCNKRWEESNSTASEEKEKKKLNKPFRLPSGEKKKFGVYVKNKKGNTILVKFGDGDMEIKRDDPKARKAFRSRHNCSEKKDKTTPGYWSCKMWSDKPVSEILGSAQEELLEEFPELTDVSEIVESQNDFWPNHLDVDIKY